MSRVERYPPDRVAMALSMHSLSAKGVLSGRSAELKERSPVVAKAIRAPVVVRAQQQQDAVSVG